MEVKEVYLNVERQNLGDSFWWNTFQIRNFLYKLSKLTQVFVAAATWKRCCDGIHLIDWAYSVDNGYNETHH